MNNIYLQKVIFYKGVLLDDMHEIKDTIKNAILYKTLHAIINFQVQEMRDEIYTLTV